MLCIHLYRVGAPDSEHQDFIVPRVSLLEDGHKFQIAGPALVLGALPNTTAIPMSQVRWFWVEEE